MMLLMLLSFLSFPSEGDTEWTVTSSQVGMHQVTFKQIRMHQVTFKQIRMYQVSLFPSLSLFLP